MVLQYFIQRVTVGHDFDHGRVAPGAVSGARPDGRLSTSLLAASGVLEALNALFFDFRQNTPSYASCFVHLPPTPGHRGPCGRVGCQRQDGPLLRNRTRNVCWTDF